MALYPQITVICVGIVSKVQQLSPPNSASHFERLYKSAVLAYESVTFLHALGAGLFPFVPFLTLK